MARDKQAIPRPPKQLSIAAIITGLAIILDEISARVLSPFASRTCDDSHKYTTEIVSLDPLVIYIHNFLSVKDMSGILEASENRFSPSLVKKDGKLVQNTYRTSWSAILPDGDPSVRCVLDRSKSFLGTMLEPIEVEIGVPQLVRYTEGQEYNLHHDWMRVPQRAFDGSPRSFNRVASFFVILQDGCEGGETWFPFIKNVSPQSGEDRLWHEHEEGGLSFKPVAGNGIFWINLFPNATGDTRTVHSGLPVTGV
ncbi:hypothetical protein F5Y16DRAFT_410133 [Xylariaceae sp. FL0255]|nr:hypothetical protein F5Y16DRAFT_410133 [Xylariaceae sp. FL0255]